MERFTGNVEYLCPVNATDLTKWIEAIPFEKWPQQNPLDDGLMRPAMVKDLEWHGFGAVAEFVVSQVMARFPGCDSANWLLTVNMPNAGIDPHTDAQPDHWVTRVHVPLTTNDESQFVVGGESHHMEVGHAYLVNTIPVHSVWNGGATPRVHFMFDVLRAA